MPLLNKTNTSANTDIHKERKTAPHNKRTIYIIKQKALYHSLKLPLHIKLCFTVQFREFDPNITPTRKTMVLKEQEICSS